MKITLITSCYNGSESLYRTYESLSNQTDHNFEWILVDDFSNDNGATRKLIEEIAEIALFEVKFIFLEENFLAAMSVVSACDVSSGDYACILDQDDELMPDAVEMVRMTLWEHVNDHNLAGISGRCIDQNKRLIGKKFQCGEFISNERIVRFKNRHTFELCHFTRVDILKDIFSKMRPGYSNGFAWSIIGKKHKQVYTNHVYRFYDTGNMSSISKTWNKVDDANYASAKRVMYLNIMNDNSGFLRYNPIYSLRLAAQFDYFDTLCAVPLKSVGSTPKDVRFFIFVARRLRYFINMTRF